MSGKEKAMSAALRKKEHDDKYDRASNEWEYARDMGTGVQAQRDIAHWGENKGGLMGRLARGVGKMPDATGMDYLSKLFG